MARGPVGYTCPGIDLVLAGIKESQLSLKGLDAILEELRNDNDSLRTWGHEQEDKTIELQDALDAALDKIQELENEGAHLLTLIN